MTTLNLGTLLVTLEAESGKYKAELVAAGDAAKQMERTAGQATKSTENNLKNLQKSFKQTTQAISTVAGGLALAWKTLGEAASLDRLEQRFEAAAASIGTSAGSLRASLEEAGGGMMSTSEMMSGALNLIDTGLADSADETVRLQRLVSELNWDMQALTLTMLNDSKMRLDTLRLSAERVEELEQKYLKMGIAHEEAFDMAVIEAGEEKLAQYGSALNTMEGDLRRIEAAAKDARDSLLNLIAERAGPALAELSGRLDEQLLNTIESRLATMTTTQELIEYGLRIQEQNDFAAWFAGATEPLNEGLMLTIERLARASSGIDEFRDNLEAMDLTISRGGSRVKTPEGWLDIAELWNTQLRQAERERIDNILELNRVTRDMDAETGKTVLTLQDLAKTERELTYTTQASVSAGRERAQAYVEEAEAAARLRDGVELLGNAAAEMGNRFEGAKAPVDEFARMAGANFITAMDNGLEATYNFNEELFRGLAPMIESKDALFGMADALNSSLTPAEMDAYWQTAQLMAQIEFLTQQVAEGKMTTEEATQAWLAFKLQTDAGLDPTVDWSDIAAAHEHTNKLLQDLIAINGFEASAHVNVTYSTSGGMDFTAPGRIGGERRASGGVIGGGVPGVDSVPVLAMPGEIVLPTRVTRDYPGGPTAMFNDLMSGNGAGDGDTNNTYHISLVIDGRRSELPAGPDDAEPFLAAARRLGVPV